jgi:GPI ethanolamine phosphate transferase 3 subunit O
VVLLIIDALMFDFADFDPLNMHPLAYQNKMPVFRDLLQSKPKNSRLFKFIADPPTTTMQRLKGLTTGSLPTFIDAGSNFASSEIDEDNFLDQISKYFCYLFCVGVALKFNVLQIKQEIDFNWR